VACLAAGHDGYVRIFWAQRVIPVRVSDCLLWIVHCCTVPIVSGP